MEMDIESPRSVSSKVILPPIPNTALTKVRSGGNLEKRIENLEVANMKLVEIVFQLKDNLQSIVKSQTEKQSSNFLFSSSDNTEAQARLGNSVMRLAEELIQLKNQASLQAQFITNSTDRITGNTRKLQQDCSTNLDILAERVNKIQDDSRQIIDCALTHQDLSDSMSNFRSELRNMRGRLDEITSSNVNTEANLAFRITDLVQKLQNESKNRETEVLRLESILTDTKHMQESNRMVLENHLSGMLSESQAKLMDREIFTRSDMMDKIQKLEQMILSEREARGGREKEIHSRINEVTERAMLHQTEAVETMRENLQRSTNKTADAIHQLEDGLRLIEQNTDEKIRKYYQVTTAEVGARKKLQDTIRTDLLILEERIRAATAAMQLAISGLANRIKDQSDLDHLRQDIERRCADSQLYISRNIADIDSQIQNMNSQIANITVHVESRIAQATNDLASEVRETLSSVMAWQANSTAHLREMQNIRVSLMQELSKMQLTLNHIESEIPAQVTMETDERISAIADIRHQMETLKMAVNTQPVVKEVDIDRIRESIRKLAETLQTMKSTVGMKIQSEQDIRIKQINDLQAEMRYLEELFMRDKNTDLIGSKPINYFIKKNDEIDGVEWFDKPIAMELLNHWSIYSSWRWLKLKKKLDTWRVKSKGALKRKKNKKTKK